MEFKSLSIVDPILKALKLLGYLEATPIQAKTIPLLIGGKDVIGIAQTGTGKTAAFGIPALQKLAIESKGRGKSPRVLILAPTRELAAQIVEEVEGMAKFLDINCLAVYGGVKIGAQIKALQRGVDVLVATPGRLIDLMNQRKVKLDEVEFLVLDEADRMLDMGFLRDVKKIIKSCKEEKQTLFFSATMSREIEELTESFLRDPVKIEITPQSMPVDKIEQCIFFVDRKNKEELLLDLIKQQNMKRVLVFVGMKHKANKVAMILNKSGISAAAIHGNKSQFQRTKALKEFKIGAVLVLVATDIAARGIDVDKITHVINYDLPNEPENYVHRIGRTARAGTDGVAYSFCSADERNYLNQIERVTKKKIGHAEHKWHSAVAKSATGVEAKPKPRRQGVGRGRGRDKRKSGARGRRSENRGVRGVKKVGSRRVAMGRTRSRR